MARSLSLVALALAWAATPALAEDGPFVFVSMPDTQVYAEDRLPEPGRTPVVTDERGTGAIFFDQTEWIVENAEALDIRYVGHLGDIVQSGEKIEEWELAHAAMDALLQADIPHGTVMGNHDDIPVHGPEYISNYLAYFGPDQFADRPWYTASSPGGGANVQMLNHGPYKIGFLNFSIDHPRTEVEWATDFVTSNPDTIFIIGTHRYLYDFKLGGGRYAEEAPTELGITINLPQGFVPGVTDGLTAEELFNEFVRVNPNVLMIHAGHFHAEWLRLDGVNEAGNQIIQILTDYQSTRNGGDGYLRIYELDFETDQLRFHTYSPTLDRRRTVMDHFVETIYLVWDQRDQVKEVLDIPNDTIFLQLIPLILKESPDVPDGLLLQHPDFDEPHERAYYEQYLDELFHGERPRGFENILDWEKLWFFGFAADRENLLDFSDGPRSPSGVVPVDFSAYFTPSEDQLLAFAFERLLAGIAGVDAGDFTFPRAPSLLERRVRQAQRRAEKGFDRGALRLLRYGVLPRVDGCAERGEPDGIFRWFWWFWHWIWSWFNSDWIDTCAAQAEVHDPLVEVMDLLR